jgi:hypothetical protein
MGVALLVRWGAEVAAPRQVGAWRRASFTLKLAVRRPPDIVRTVDEETFVREALLRVNAASCSRQASTQRRVAVDADAAVSTTAKATAPSGRCDQIPSN